jgi:hypothetical protein
LTRRAENRAFPSQSEGKYGLTDKEFAFKIRAVLMLSLLHPVTESPARRPPLRAPLPGRWLRRLERFHRADQAEQRYDFDMAVRNTQRPFASTPDRNTRPRWNAAS